MKKIKEIYPELKACGWVLFFLYTMLRIVINGFTPMAGGAVGLLIVTLYMFLKLKDEEKKE